MKKFTFRESLIAISFLIILFLLRPLEYDGFKVKTIFYPFIWIGVAVICINLLPRKNSIIKIIVVAIGVIVYGLVTCFFALGFLLCGWASHGTLYTNKKENSIKIVCRTYDCYGTAEGCELFKEKQLTKHFKWVTEFNDNPIDSNQWKSSNEDK